MCCWWKASASWPTCAQIGREQEAWLTQRHRLEGELQGLNNRIAHQRQTLQQHESPRQLGSAIPENAPTLEAHDAAVAARSAELDRLAGELADQRTLLIEQWERLARLQQEWQAQHDAAAGELEILARRLLQQEEALAQREQKVEVDESRLRRWQEQLDWAHRQTALALARAQAQQQAWETERTEVLGRTAALSQQASRQLEALGELRRRWDHRRQQQAEALRSERESLVQLRRKLIEARQELEQHAQQLETARRTLAEEAMALEDGTEEAAHRGGGFTDRQQQPLRLRWLTQNAAVVRSLRQQRERLKGELDSLHRLHEEVAAMAQRLAKAQSETREQQTALEHREAQLAANEAALEQAQHNAQQRQLHTDRRLAALQEEAEQMARALIPDTEALPAALERAA